MDTLRATAMLLGLTVSALCSGLTVRIINRREKWAKRAAVAVAIFFILYAPSFGPFAWMQRNRVLPVSVEAPLSWLYLPMFLLIDAPEPIHSLFRRYLRYWV